MKENEKDVRIEKLEARVSILEKQVQQVIAAAIQAQMTANMASNR